MVISLLGGRGLWGLLGVTPIESINASGRVDQLLLAGKERVAR